MYFKPKADLYVPINWYEPDNSGFYGLTKEAMQAVIFNDTSINISDEYLNNLNKMRLFMHYD